MKATWWAPENLPSWPQSIRLTLSMFTSPMNERDLLRVTGETGLSPAQAQNLKIPLSLGLANETGYPHKGYFDFAAISLTPTTGTLQLRGIFPNPDGKILPGSFARVRVPVVGTEKTALVVPEVALGYDQLGPYVLLVDEQESGAAPRRSNWASV